MSQLSTNITNIKSNINTIKQRLGLPANSSMADIISYLPQGGYTTAYLVSSTSQLENIDASDGDIALLYETTYIPAGESTFGSQYAFYMPKVVQDYYMLPLPKVMNGSVMLSNTGTLTLTCNGNGVYTFTFYDAESIWEGHSTVCVEYQIVNGLWNRTSIYDYDTSESLDNSMDYLYINSGNEAGFNNWTDNILQFQQIPIGKRATRMFEYDDGTGWNEQAFGYTMDSGKASLYGVNPVSNQIVKGNTFVGTNGYESGDIEEYGKYDNMSFRDVATQFEIGMLNRIQYNLSKVPNGTGGYGSGYTKLIYGWPISTDGTVYGNTNSEQYKSNNKITVVPKGVITSARTSMSSCFESDKRLYAVEYMDTSNVTNMSKCFYKCYNLQHIPVMNWAKLTTATNCFQLCHVLTEDSLNNILLSCSTVTSAYTKPKTLSELGFTEWQADICTTLSNWSTAQNTGWTTGYEVV